MKHTERFPNKWESAADAVIHYFWYAMFCAWRLYDKGFFVWQIYMYNWLCSIWKLELKTAMLWEIRVNLIWIKYQLIQFVISSYSSCRLFYIRISQHFIWVKESIGTEMSSDTLHTLTITALYKMDHTFKWIFKKWVNLWRKKST